MVFSKKERTDIEIILEKILKKLKVKYESQKDLSQFRTIPDFFIPPNIVLYADGDFWHNRKRNKRRDSRINRELIKAGYCVVRFSGSFIKSSLAEIEQILQCLTGAKYE
jgi:very-short-patch-repair endonuclease